MYYSSHCVLLKVPSRRLSGGAVGKEEGALRAEGQVEQLRELSVAARRALQSAEPAKIVLQVGPSHTVKAMHSRLEASVVCVDGLDMPGTDSMDARRGHHRVVLQPPILDGLPD